MKIDEVFALEKRKSIGIQGIDVEIRASIDGEVSDMVAEIKKTNKNYKVYFHVDRRIFLAEAIRRPGMKKGLILDLLNPCYLLVGDRGIEPLTSSVSRRQSNFWRFLPLLKI
jgi:hypothetical protein